MKLILIFDFVLIQVLIELRACVLCFFHYSFRLPPTQCVIFHLAASICPVFLVMIRINHMAHAHPWRNAAERARQALEAPLCSIRKGPHTNHTRARPTSQCNVGNPLVMTQPTKARIHGQRATDANARSGSEPLCSHRQTPYPTYRSSAVGRGVSFVQLP